MYDTTMEFIMIITSNDNWVYEKMNNDSVSKQNWISDTCRQTNWHIVLYAVIMMAYW